MADIKQIQVGSTTYDITLGSNLVDVLASGNPASNVEVWIDESEEYGELTPNQIVQTTGQSTTNVMSQKAVTDAIEAGGGGGTPAAYLKSASISGNTLTLTNKDDTTVVYTPDLSGKQDVLTAGDNINISGSTISALKYYKQTEVTGVAGTSTTKLSSTYDVTDSSVTSYYDGMLVTFVLPVAGASTYGSVFQFNSLGYHPIVYGASSIVGTRYPVGGQITMIYNSVQTANAYLTKDTKTTITGCWQVCDYDATTKDATKVFDNYLRPYAGASAIYRYKLCALDKDNRVAPITITKQDTSEQVAKTPNSVGLKTGDLWFYNSSTNISASKVIGAGTLATTYYGDNMCQYNFNASIPAYRMIYLRGTYNTTTGLFTLYNDGSSPCTSYYTSVPNNTANITLSSYFVSGYYYWLVGSSYSTADYLQVFGHNPLYYFDGTNLIPYQEHLVALKQDASTLEADVAARGFTKNAGTVTSVAAGTGLSVSGTASVNPTVNVASGYKLPTTSEWSGKEDTANKTTKVYTTSTDTQYPTTKAVYNTIDKNDDILLSAMYNRQTSITFDTNNKFYDGYVGTDGVLVASSAHCCYKFPLKYGLYKFQANSQSVMYSGNPICAFFNSDGTYIANSAIAGNGEQYYTITVSESYPKDGYMLFNHLNCYTIKDYINALTEIEFKPIEDVRYKTCVNKPYNFAGKKLQFFGDSITYGLINDVGQSSYNYPKVFSEHVGAASYSNQGVSGATLATDTGYTSILTTIQNNLDTTADYVFIAGGINDWQIGLHGFQIRTAVLNICNYLKANYTGEVIFITPINNAGVKPQTVAKTTVEHVREIITRAVLESGYSVVAGNEFPFPTATDDSAYITAMFQDKLHPTDLGYQMYAKALANALCSSEGCLGTAYVTPEMYGAVGDGTTDDTSAMSSCLASGKTIIFPAGKTYLIGKISLPDVTNIRLYGNNSTIKGGPILLNVNEADNTWVHAFPGQLSLIEYVRFRQTTNTISLHLGLQIELNSLDFTDCATCVKFTQNYIDRVVLRNIEISNWTSAKTAYSFIAPLLGDEIYLTHVHEAGNYKGKTLSLFQANTTVITQCLNISVHCNASSMITFNNCHFEGDSSITGSRATSNIVFNNCYMWAGNMLYDTCHYNNCLFGYNNQTYNGYTDSGYDFTDCYKHFDKCYIGVSDANTLDFTKHLISKESYDYIKGAAHKDDKQVLYPNTFSLGAKGLTGTYSYTIFGSDSDKGFVNTSQYNIYTYTATLNQQGVGFTNQVLNKFIWVYRTNPDGTIQRAILPPVGATRIFDLGATMNGFKWTTVTEITKPTEQNWTSWTGFCWNSQPTSKASSEYYITSSGTLAK